MGYQPWYKLDTFPALQIPLFVESNPDNITGLAANNFTMVLRNTATGTPVDTTGTGTFIIVTSNPAVIQYQFSAADVANTFSGFLSVRAQFPTGLAVYDPIAFTITDD